MENRINKFLDESPQLKEYDENYRPETIDEKAKLISCSTSMVLDMVKHMRPGMYISPLHLMQTVAFTVETCAMVSSVQGVPFLVLYKGSLSVVSGLILNDLVWLK